jgi:ribosomal protein S18 acetylase RimI-like enzyme
MTYSIVEAVPCAKAHKDAILRLQKECLPEADVWPVEGSFWWLAKDERGYVGFAGLHVENFDHGIGSLCRAGVVEAARGHGLQRQLIKARALAAQAMGLRRLTTYTHVSNIPSSNNLIACGFRLYEPPKGWAEDEFLYWEKEL